VTTKKSSHQHVNEAEERERNGKESDAVSRRESKQKAEVANAKERQRAKVMRRVARTDASYVDPPSAKTPRYSLGVPGRIETSARNIASGRERRGSQRASH
jgi:hypothetical protein